MEFIVMTRDMLDAILDRMERIERKLSEREADDQRHYTVEQAMDILKVSRKTLQLLRDHRKIGFVQFGRNILFPRTELEAFLKRNHLKPRL